MLVHCLFEQSGTFKKEFIKLGHAAFDYDIQNEYGQTDYVIDLFNEIEKGARNEPSIFDTIKKNDLMFAFFPCTRFEARVPLLSRGEAYQMANWSTTQKLNYSIKIVDELNQNYQLISKLALIAIDRGLKLIIENPMTPPHFLTQYWPIKPALIDWDRRERGDKFKKPTQYFFIGLEPKTNFIWEPQPHTAIQTEIIAQVKGSGAKRAAKRSEITPEYANRFIREFIL